MIFNHTPLPRPAGRFRAILPALALAAMTGAMLAEPARAADSPFAAFDGRWAGSGTMTRANGTKERLRCTVDYIFRDRESALQQTLRCDSDSYKFNVNSYIIEKDGSLSGNWTDESNQVTGSVSGRLRRNAIDAQVRGTGFTAEVGISLSGRNQTVNIRTQAGDIREVSLRINRGR